MYDLAIAGIRFANDSDLTQPSINSLYDGYTNTSNRYAIETHYPTTVIKEVWDHTYSGYSDWYVPSYNELLLAMQNASALFEYNAFWTSTVVANTKVGSSYTTGVRGISFDSSSGPTLVDINWKDILGLTTDPNDQYVLPYKPFRRIAI